MMHTFFRGKVGRIMAKRYEEEFKTQAVRLVADHRDEYDSEFACIEAVARRLSVSTETLRRWVRQNQVDVCERDGVSSETARENRELKRKNRELEEIIEILKAATSFFVRESDPRQR